MEIYLMKTDSMRIETLSVCLIVVLGVSLLLATNVFAAKQKMTIEQVEEKVMFDDFFQLAEDAMVRSKDRSDARLTQCLKAFGHLKFCECIKEKLPVYQSFDSYFFIITTPKDELNYENLDGDDKGLLDNTHKTRDICVKESF